MPSGRSPDGEDTLFTVIGVPNDIADQPWQVEIIIESFKREMSLVESGLEIKPTGVLPPMERRPLAMAKVFLMGRTRYIGLFS
jgi:hypothetical protein